MADYVLFVDKKSLKSLRRKGIEGHQLTVVEEQSVKYATSKLKYLNNNPLPFVYEINEKMTRFTDLRDPKPRSRPIFSFHLPETSEEYLKKKPLRDSVSKIRKLIIS
jgi:type I restriction enzyme R subunit